MNPAQKEFASRMHAFGSVLNPGHTEAEPEPEDRPNYGGIVLAYIIIVCLAVSAIMLTLKLGMVLFA